tara:strand:+ start:60 stop:263 length:204 start_codon:yes stop_codon:yes gene_type:complete
VFDMSHYHPEDFEHLKDKSVIKTNKELASYHKSEIIKFIKAAEFHKKEHLKYVEIINYMRSQQSASD